MFGEVISVINQSIIWILCVNSPLLSLSLSPSPNLLVHYMGLLFMIV